MRVRVVAQSSLLEALTFWVKPSEFTEMPIGLDL